MTINPYDEMMTEAEQVCRDEGWLTPLEVFDLRQEITRLREIEAAARDSATRGFGSIRMRDALAAQCNSSAEAQHMSKTAYAGSKPLTDDTIHAMALTLRSWLPGEAGNLLLGTVEHALRKALAMGIGNGESPILSPGPRPQSIIDDKTASGGDRSARNDIQHHLYEALRDMLSDHADLSEATLDFARAAITRAANAFGGELEPTPKEGDAKGPDPLQNSPTPLGWNEIDPQSIGSETAQMDQRWDYDALCAAARAMDRLRAGDDWASVEQAASCVDAYLAAVAREEREEYEREQAASEKACEPSTRTGEQS